MSAPAAAFQDPVLGSQAVFRTVLDAMAHPGRILPLVADPSPPHPLYATTAAVLLTLADYETPVWLNSVFAGAAAYVRFHTGAHICANERDAVFAVSTSAALPDFGAFKQGNAEYPDRSTTIIVQSERLAPAGLTLCGPGISGTVQFGFSPAPGDIAARICANRELFPLGIDLIVTDAMSVAALPRSVVVSGS